MENKMMNDLKEVLFTEDQIAKRAKELGEQISKDYEGEEIALICILKGGVMFFTQLAKHIAVPVEYDFMAVSSYGKEFKSSGEVRIIKDINISVEGKNIIFVEDIVDSGYTLRYLTNMFKARGCKSIKICALLDKPSRRETEIQADYFGFEVGNQFVVGYGLDYDGYYRNLPLVGVLKEEVYTQEK